MKTEMEKCLAGEWYDCHNQVFLDLKTRTYKLLIKYNSLPYEDKEEKHSLLKKILGSIGMKVSVASPFICDYGCNIHIGDNVTVNTGWILYFDISSVIDSAFVFLSGDPIEILSKRASISKWRSVISQLL